MGLLTGNLSSQTVLIFLDSFDPLLGIIVRYIAILLSIWRLESYFALITFSLVEVTLILSLALWHDCVACNLQSVWKVVIVWNWDGSFLKSAYLSWLSFPLVLHLYFFLRVDFSNVLTFAFPWDCFNKQFFPFFFNSPRFSLQNLFSSWLWKKWTSQGKEMDVLRLRK